MEIVNIMKKNFPKGNIVFDYGYLLGHIALHTLTSPEKIMASMEAFMKGYGETDFKEETVKKIALGSMLYRLDSIVPYLVNLDFRSKKI